MPNTQEDILEISSRKPLTCFLFFFVIFVAQDFLFCCSEQDALIFPISNMSYFGIAVVSPIKQNPGLESYCHPMNTRFLPLVEFLREERSPFFFSVVSLRFSSFPTQHLNDKATQHCVQSHFSKGAIKRGVID